MGDGGTNDGVDGRGADEAARQEVGGGANAAGPVPAPGEDGPGDLSRTAAVAVTVLAILCGCTVMLAMFSWLGWSVPGVGWIVAKAGIKLAVGGFAGLAAAAAWARAKLRAGGGS
ncbi:hypothetical protein ACGF07_23025 [Kitasatospora sp. NPDC048194]|uniref:hypothetical protein n=1 Tax=Kitasatospora sp. NPDC048194 TaxID=3364045 RepID=UPI0037216CC3